MKVCEACGDSYRDHVEFCFNDGDVLVYADAVGSTRTVELDIDAPPLPPRAAMASGTDDGTGTPTAQAQGPWPAMSATPVPRANRRSLLRGATPSYTPPSPTPVPVDNVPDPPEAAEPVGPPTELEDPSRTPVAGMVAPRPPPSEVDTAPLPRPQREPTTSNPPDPVRRAPGVRPVAPTPVPRAATLEIEALEEPSDTRGMLMAGVAAAVLGLCFVLGSGFVLLWMGAGLLPGDPVGVMASQPPNPVAPALPEPVRSPDPAPDEPAPLEGPQPVEPAQVDPEPLPEPLVPPSAAPTIEPRPVPALVPRPTPSAPPAPALTDDAVAMVEPPAPAPAPAPAPPLPVPVVKVAVKFSSEPAGAEVWVDGTLVVESSPGTADIEAGPRKVEMRLDGYVPYAVAFDPAPGAEVRGTLRQLEAARLQPVMVMGPVSWVLFVDGARQGALPLKVMVGVGAHEFKIVDGAGNERQFILPVETSTTFLKLPD